MPKLNKLGMSISHITVLGGITWPTVTFHFCTVPLVGGSEGESAKFGKGISIRELVALEVEKLWEENC
jgi:hypothetical protein|tara:strand:+ start:476 stop:679 length:204 start_codon:yes stop_codon:yes gene_type:complete